MKTFLILSFLTISTVFYSSAFIMPIDGRQSNINFSIGNMRINNVSGTFTGMTGEVNFNPENIAESYFNVCIDASTVDTDNRRRDDHLREDDYFYVEKFPEICYVSDDISRTADGFVTRGKLTIKGITRIVTIPFVKQDNLLTGTFTLNRLDYNVGEGTGTFLVSNPVEVTINCVLIP